MASFMDWQTLTETIESIGGKVYRDPQRLFIVHVTLPIRFVFDYQQLSQLKPDEVRMVMSHHDTEPRKGEVAMDIDAKNYFDFRKWLDELGAREENRRRKRLDDFYNNWVVPLQHTCVHWNICAREKEFGTCPCEAFSTTTSKGITYEQCREIEAMTIRTFQRASQKQQEPQDFGPCWSITV